MNPPLRSFASAAGVLILWTGFILVSRAGRSGTLTPWHVIGIHYTVAGGLLSLAWWYMGQPALLHRHFVILPAVGVLGRDAVHRKACVSLGRAIQRFRAEAGMSRSEPIRRVLSQCAALEAALETLSAKPASSSISR